MATHNDGGCSLASYGRPCPICNGSTYRIPRRLVDRIVNLFTPVYRYRCRTMNCIWEGNIRKYGADQLNISKEK